MTVTGQELIKSFGELVEYHSGDKNHSVQGIENPSAFDANKIVVLNSNKMLKELSGGGGGILVLPKEALASLGNWSQERPKMQPPALVLTSKIPLLALAEIGRKFFAPYPNRRPFDGHRIHPTAQISSTAMVGENVQVGPFAVIGDKVRLHDDAIIGAHTVIEAEAQIGKGTFIQPQVYIGYGTVIGSGCDIKPQTTIGTEGYGYAHNARGEHFRIPHVGTVVIGDRVDIGSGVIIDRGTLGYTAIGEGTKIDNHCHIAHNVQIGKHCLITAGLIVAGSAKIGDHCVFGGRTTINGHIEICSGARIGALSGVTDNIKSPGDYAGYPPLPFKDHLKVVMSLRSLPRLRKQMSRVFKHLGLESLEKDNQ